LDSEFACWSSAAGCGVEREERDVWGILALLNLDLGVGTRSAVFVTLLLARHSWCCDDGGDRLRCFADWRRDKGLVLIDAVIKLVSTARRFDKAKRSLVIPLGD